MKYQACLLIFFSFLHGVLSSQSCLPQGITFETQGQIDSFEVNYPGCNEIEGDVNIYWSNITNLNGLYVISSIGGDLEISGVGHLANIAGLENLNFIGGSIHISGNDSLASLTGVENLDSVGGNFRIQSNPVLMNLDGFQGLDYLGGFLWIIGNDALTSIGGLHNLHDIGGGLTIRANAALNSLEGLNNIDSIPGDLKLLWTTLTDLSGLDNLTRINGDLIIIHCDYLTELNPLGNLTSIGSDLEITYNEILTTLSGLDNIEAGSIMNLYVYQNFALSTCDVQSVCDYLANPNGIVSIGSNAPGCNSPEEIEAACGVGTDESAVSNQQSAVRIYPNPLKDITTFKYELQAPVLVSLTIFNYLGQQIALLVNEQQDKGEYLVTWNAEGLPSGIYFYRLMAGNRSSLGKMVK